MTQHHHLPLSAALLTLSAYIGFSGFDSISRLLMVHYAIPQAQVMALVMLSGLIPIFLMIHVKDDWGKLKPKAPKLILARAALACVEVWLAFQTFQLLKLAESYALFFTYPLWVLLLSSVFLKERISRTKQLALMIGFIGALVATNPSLDGLSFGQATGLGAAFCAGCGTIIMRHLGKTESSGTILIALFGGQVLFNSAMMPGWTPLSLTVIGLIILAGLIVGAGYCCLILALQRAPAPLIAPFQYTQILWALLFGLFLFNETPTAYTLSGLAIISLAGLILMKRKRPPKAFAPKPAA